MVSELAAVEKPAASIPTAKDSLTLMVQLRQMA
jgi:hypothetical protein